LNIAVDSLLKKEFDHYRQLKKAHPLMIENGIDAIPFEHELIEEWRDSLRRGVQYQVPQTNLLITGGCDDIWVCPKGQLIVVDYKATSKAKEVSIDEEWQISYKRQVEIYQWLFRKNGFQVSNTAYFVYCNGIADAEGFDSKLSFKIKVLPYIGSADWVDKTISELYSCLGSATLPTSAEDCKFCSYRKNASLFESS
jgi:hypothetical protein